MQYFKIQLTTILQFNIPDVFFPLLLHKGYLCSLIWGTDSQECYSSMFLSRLNSFNGVVFIVMEK